MEIILEKILRQGKKDISIGIGFNSATTQDIQRIERSVHKLKDLVNVTVVGNRRLKINTYKSDAPEEDLIKLLKNGEIQAAVRGILSINKISPIIKSAFNLDKLYRIALLRAQSAFFFLAPVGIDEGKTISEKLKFVDYGLEFLKKINIRSKVGILSSGRLEDVGRSSKVDKTLAEAELLARILAMRNIEVKHYAILIEDAIAERTKFILAPDGIIGNFIFRTLVFLGQGIGYGAPIVNLKSIFLDTSRNKSSYVHTIVFAALLALNETQHFSDILSLLAQIKN